jgi:CTP:molybdopterin cytidylyltransferase MocA
MKGVIATGGKGGRLNLGSFPVCKGLLEVNGEPLISLQLRQMREIGVEEVFLCVSRESVARDYESMMSFLPALTYHVSLHPHGGHPLCAFRDEMLCRSLAGSDFIFTYDDLYYSHGHLSAALSVRAGRHNSVGTIQDSNPGLRRYRVNGQGVVLFPRSPDGLYVGPPYVFASSVLPVIERAALKQPPQTDSILDECARRAKLLSLRPSILINVNTMADLERVKDELCGRGPVSDLKRNM